jgi:hypothetical protein
MEKEQKKEIHSVKYIRELTEYYDVYIAGLIDEIYIGVGIALGLDDAKARKLAQSNPKLLQKAFFRNIIDRLKSIFHHGKPSKFNLRRGTFGDGSAMTPAQWIKFNAAIDNYWKEHADRVTEDVAVKSFMLGRETTNFRRKKKPYQHKSITQVNTDQFQGKMPQAIADAYRKYDFTNAEKNALNKSFSNLAMHVAETNNEIKEAIRTQVQQGTTNNESPAEIASDLYWEIQKGDLNNKYTAESLKRNWNRIAITESASIYEAGILAPYEAEAMDSMKDQSKAKYFVFTGGTCPWCRSHHGTLVRLIPSALVTDTSNDSLKAMGITDPITDIAVWVGKNNIGFKHTSAEDTWRVCCPAHPHNVATLQPIDPETEYYDEKTDRIQKRKKELSYLPKSIDHEAERTRIKEIQKPVFIGDNLIRAGYNTYELVDKSEYNQRMEAYKKDSTLPLPFYKESTDYIYIYKEAEKNR